MRNRPMAFLCLALMTACGSSDDPAADTETSSGTESETGSDATDDAGDGDGDTGEVDTGDGDGTDTSDSGDTGSMGGCGALVDGMNMLDVGGTQRMVILSLPSDVDAGGPWPVVFNWHGLGDSAANMSGLVDPYVDGPDYNFIGVTPEDADYQLETLLGVLPMDWDIFMVSRANTEMALFDRVLECLDEQYGVDADRVHSMGFSLGGIASDLIGTMRGDEIASIATYSGGYWNNPNAELGLVGSVVNWPEHTTANTYAQLFLHGGANDTYALGPTSIVFSDYAISDADWLAGKGHTTFLCDHGGGHTAPPSAMGPDKLLKFFADHPRGEASPYAGNVPGDWPDYCAEITP